MKTVRFNTDKNAIRVALIENAIMILITTILILGQISWISHLLGKYGKSFFDNMEIIPTILFVVYLLVNVFLSIGVILIAIPFILWGRFYQIKDYTEINESILTQVEFGFPYSRNEESTVCHQITSVEITQTTLERMFEVGDVKITVITKTNTEVEEFEITICGVNNPQNVGKTLIELFPTTSTLEVSGITG